MKNLTKNLIPITLVIGVFCCTPQEDLIKDQKGTIQLSFSEGTNPNGRISDLPDNLFASVSIENEMGESVLTSEKIELFKFNNEYLSKPISLVAGMYHLTEYLILDSQNNVLLATPKYGSEMADLVEHPLPISFAVSKDEITKLIPEVLFVDDQTPKDFGYISFEFEIVETFLITTLGLSDDGEFELITPNILLIHDTDTVYRTVGEKGVTIIPYTAADSEYNLVVYQRGFERYGQVFSVDSLQLYNDKPLVVALNPAFTFEARVYDYQIPVGWESISIGATINGPSSFTLDNGYEKVNLTSEGIGGLFYNIAPSRPGYHFISITGDLDNIVSLFDGYHESRNTDFRRLVNLERMWVGGLFCGGSDRTLDLSKNTKLKYVEFHGIHECDSIVLKDHKELLTFDLEWSSISKLRITCADKLTNLWVTQCENLEDPSTLMQNPGLMSIYLSMNDFGQHEVDSILKELYNSLVDHPRKNGSLVLSDNASPSSTGLEYVSLLKSEFNWGLSYEE